MTGLTRGDVVRLVNRYIGGDGGYLADFTKKTLRDFYPEFCNIDIDPESYPGTTTRERFMSILEGVDPASQLRILRGVLEKYPSGSSSIRTPEAVRFVEELIRRLEGASGVPSAHPVVASAIVTRAIDDAEALLRSTGATSGVDRMHTAFHGFLLAVCDQAGIAHGPESAITQLYKLIREKHPAFRDIGPHGGQVDRILKSFAAAVDALNTLRNHASVAHPNGELLGPDEAILYVHSVRTLMAYLDSKVSEVAKGRVSEPGVDSRDIASLAGAWESVPTAEELRRDQPADCTRETL
jgi:hypothetical protein